MNKLITGLAFLGLAGVAYKYRSEIMNEMNDLSGMAKDKAEQAKPKMKELINKAAKKQPLAPTFMDTDKTPVNQNKYNATPTKKTA